MKSFCGVCNKMVDYIIEDAKCENEVVGIVVTYDSKVAKCIHCGEELFVDEVEDYNQIQFEAVYKRIAKTITIEEINEILLKYNITKRNLPLLLGWGEITITRYLDGKYIPSKKNSDELKKILNSPDYYYSLLEDNKDLIVSKNRHFISIHESLANFLHIDNEYLVENGFSSIIFLTL